MRHDVLQKLNMYQQVNKYHWGRPLNPNLPEPNHHSGSINMDALGGFAPNFDGQRVYLIFYTCTSYIWSVPAFCLPTNGCFVRISLNTSLLLSHVVMWMLSYHSWSLGNGMSWDKLVSYHVVMITQCLYPVWLLLFLRVDRKSVENRLASGVGRTPGPHHTSRVAWNDKSLDG